MPNYWLGIMALTLAATLGLWILLVLWSGGKSLGRRQDNSPHREVLGGTFEARRGGRQVMPNPVEPITQEPGLADGEQTHGSAATGQVSDVKVPEQGKGPVAEETPSPYAPGTTNAVFVGARQTRCMRNRRRHAVPGGSSG